jgi:hypothetical protein
LTYFFDASYLASIDKTPAESTSSEAAAKGFLAMSLTFSSILSRGLKTNLLASLVKKIEAMESTMQTNIVLAIERTAFRVVDDFIE